MPNSDPVEHRRYATRWAAERYARLSAAGFCVRCGNADVSKTPFVHCTACRRSRSKTLQLASDRRRVPCVRCGQPRTLRSVSGLCQSCVGVTTSEKNRKRPHRLPCVDCGKPRTVARNTTGRCRKCSSTAAMLELRRRCSAAPPPPPTTTADASTPNNSDAATRAGASCAATPTPA